MPFSELSPMEAGMKIALEGLRVTIPAGISRNMFRLINICLNEDPGRRPNFDQVIPVLEKMGEWIRNKIIGQGLSPKIIKIKFIRTY